MRISEKTLEVTICAQLSARMQLAAIVPRGPMWRQPLWFGLTQRQERQAGFDVATRLGRRVVLLQFKAGRELRDGRIRFAADHAQLENLIRQVWGRRREVLYVLPAVTRTRSVPRGGEWIVDRTWVMDVADIDAGILPPNRRNGRHMLTLDSMESTVTITSRPIVVRVKKIALSAMQWIAEAGASDGVVPTYEDAFPHRLLKIAESLGRGAIGLVL